MAQQEFVLANALMLQALVAMEDVMGKKGLDAILHSAGLEKFIDNFPLDDLNPAVSYEDYAQLNQAIEEFYGRGGRGILRRIGRVSFQYGLREQPALLGLAGVALKLMPKRQRVKFVLSSIGNALKKIIPKSEFWVDDRSENIAYCARACSLCQGRQHDKAVGHLFVGSLMEATKWATGEDFMVRETLCKARGDPYGRWEVMMD